MDAAPLAWFSRKADALLVKRALRHAGIKSDIRNLDQAPAGWQVVESKGVYLWVSDADLQTAVALMDALRPVSASRRAQ